MFQSAAELGSKPTSGAKWNLLGVPIDR
jgi:hypothetical protein